VPVVSAVAVVALVVKLELEKPIFFVNSSPEAIVQII